MHHPAGAVCDRGVAGGAVSRIVVRSLASLTRGASSAGQHAPVVSAALSPRGPSAPGYKMWSHVSEDTRCMIRRLLYAHLTSVFTMSLCIRMCLRRHSYKC